jgi:protease IV
MKFAVPYIWNRDFSLRFQIVFVIIILLSIPSFSAQFQEDLVKTDMYVRQMGMGGAATGVADDMSAMYYNPAGLAKSEATGISFGNIDNNKEVFEENHYYSYAFGPFNYLGYDKKLTTEDKIKMDQFSVASKSSMGLSYGLTYKNIFWATEVEEKRGGSFDLGLLLNVTPQVSIGILGQDAIAANDLEIPGTTRAGISWRPYKEWLLLAADTEVGRVAAGDYSHYGIESKISDGLQLRAGLDRGKTTIGITLNLPFIAVHYAALYDNEVPNGVIHMIGGEMSLERKEDRPFSIIRPKEFAIIEIGGNLTGGVGDFSLFGGGRIGADSIITQIKKATKDPYIDGILLRIKGFDGGLGSFGIVQEIRTELLKAKAKGFKVVAYLEEGTLGDEYYLASVADNVVASPAGTVGGLGKSISVVRVKGFLDMIGVETQTIAKGKYKTTFSSYSPEFTKEQKYMVQVVVADLYRQMVTDVETSRKGKISVTQLKDIADGSIFSAAKAKQLGLIDNIGYYNDAVKVCQTVTDSKDDVRIVQIKDLVGDLNEDFLFNFPNKVAVVDIDGEIVTGRSGNNVLFGGRATGADTVCDQIRKATDDWQVKGIILRVNSPGGSAVASGQIYSEILRAKSKGKKVVASMGDLAASGGYYVSAAADKIVANPGSITGSIGVIERDALIYSGLLKKLDIKVETVKEGKHADMYSGFRKLSSEEVKSINEYMEDTYQEFIKAVADGRGMSTKEVSKLAEGKVYTGAQAKEVKLVDKLGNFSDSVGLLAELAKINGDPQLVYYREDSFLFNFGQGAVKMLGLENGLLQNRPSGLAEYRLSF